MKPIWEVAPKAVRWFNWQYSLPRVMLPGIYTAFGLKRIGDPERPIALTCSISEDYARLWLYFARKSLDPHKWDFLIIDSAGEMDPAKFQGGQVIRFFNIAHGLKVDFFLRKILKAELVFLCDDDMYLLKDVAKPLAYLENPDTPIVSLFPRNWWKFNINGQEYAPMGSFALLFKRRFLLEHHLKFQSPKGPGSPYKVMLPGSHSKLQHYDTADYMNEQLLLAGYRVMSVTEEQYVLGFKGLSDKRMLLMRYGSDYIRQALLEAKHYKKDSMNAINMLAMYSIVKFERLYRTIFQEEPKVASTFSEEALRQVVAQNLHADPQQKHLVQQDFDGLDETYNTLIRNI